MCCYFSEERGTYPNSVSWRGGKEVRPKDAGEEVEAEWENGLRQRRACAQQREGTWQEGQRGQELPRRGR